MKLLATIWMVLLMAPKSCHGIRHLRETRTRGVTMPNRELAKCTNKSQKDKGGRTLASSSCPPTAVPSTAPTESPSEPPAILLTNEPSPFPSAPPSSEVVQELQDFPATVQYRIVVVNGKHEFVDPSEFLDKLVVGFEEMMLSKLELTVLGDEPKFHNITGAHAGVIVRYQAPFELAYGKFSRFVSMSLPYRLQRKE